MSPREVEPPPVGQQAPVGPQARQVFSVGGAHGARPSAEAWEQMGLDRVAPRRKDGQMSRISGAPDRSMGTIAGAASSQEIPRSERQCQQFFRTLSGVVRPTGDLLICSRA